MHTKYNIHLKCHLKRKLKILKNNKCTKVSSTLRVININSDIEKSQRYVRNIFASRTEEALLRNRDWIRFCKTGTLKTNHVFLTKKLLFHWNTVGSKIIRTLAIMHAIFFWFDCQFLSSHACFKQYKAEQS